MYFTVAVQSMRRACLSDSLACWINSSCLVAPSDAGSTRMGVGAYQSEAEAQVHQGQLQASGCIDDSRLARHAIFGGLIAERHVAISGLIRVRYWHCKGRIINAVLLCIEVSTYINILFCAALCFILPCRLNSIIWPSATRFKDGPLG